MPVTLSPLNAGPRRRKASGSLSMTATVWSRSSRLRASVEPTRPQPMITTCTDATLHRVADCPRGGATWTSRRAAPWSRLADPCRVVGDVSQAVLLGRALRSDQLGETLLPKRIALPVFASDALSSVAYAPDEIFSCSASPAAPRPTSGPGRSASPSSLVMVVVVASLPPERARLPLRRRRLRGGDRQPRAQAGLTVASALLVDYVLTVAVSISSGVQNAASVARRSCGGHEVDRRRRADRAASRR